MPCRCFRSRVLAPAFALAFALATATGQARAADLLPSVPPPSWNLSLRSTGYAYQTEDAAGADTDHFRFYQHIAGGASGLAGGRLAVRASGRFANSPVDAWPGWDRSRLSSGYLEARLGQQVRARVGRQFLQSGVASLTLDGAEVAWGRGRAVQVSAWGGARAPWGNAARLGDFDLDAAAGGRLSFAPGGGHRFAVSGAYRERRGVVAERPVGCEYATTAVPHVDALARAAYDLEGERWSRLEAQARWQPAPSRPALSLQYVDRHPSIDAASWFSRFTEVKRIRLARGALTWQHRSRFGGELEYVGSFVDTRASSRVGIALLLPAARVGWSVRLGDTGEENSLYGELAWRARPWLRLEGEASHLVYALISDGPVADERELTTFAARARARLRPGLDFTAEVQSLDTPVYSRDIRVLLGVDLALARGTGRTGPDRGGWSR